MHHVSVNFIRPAAEKGASGFSALTESTWLIENAEHLRTVHRDSQEKLHLLLVGQPDLIPSSVLESLGATCIIHDVSKAYKSLADEFPNVIGFFGGAYTIFGFGFLRWLIVYRIFGGEPVLCYDGDIVHNVPLDELSKAFSGITRTATSTCFASISDPEWFRSWERNLRCFEADMGSFFERYIPTLTYGFEQFKSSAEEYFAKFLIEAGELPQQELDTSFPFWIIPQPQTLPRLFNFVRIEGAEQIPPPMTYARVDGIDRINGRPVAFWHMQKPFMSQLSALAMMAQNSQLGDLGALPPFNFYGKPAAVTDYLMNDPYHHLGGTPIIPWQLYGFVNWLFEQMHTARNKGVGPTENPFHPAFLYKFYFKNHDFSLLFNNRRWPIPSVWAE
jgi:hypothetical protein